MAAYGCFVDGRNGDECVFDYNRINDCDEALRLKANGCGRNDCQHWLPIKLDKLISKDRHIEVCEKALTDILDGCDEYELRAFTGLSLERCKEICEMRNHASTNPIP